MTPHAQFVSQVYSLPLPKWCLRRSESGVVPSRGGSSLKLVVVVRSYFPFSILVGEDRLTGNIVLRYPVEEEPPPNPKAKDDVGTRDSRGF